LSFAILINYSARKWRTCPQTTVVICLIFASRFGISIVVFL
jgi:hypothetical protein